MNNKNEQPLFRKKRLSVIANLLLGGSLFASSIVMAAQPNILVISMDDANQEQIGAFGETVSPSPTPTLDQFASEGMRFTNAHTVAANCNPSRNSMLSGTYPHQNGVVGFRQVWKSASPILPHIMQNNGYLTGLFGKDTHATPYFPFQWDLLGDEDLTHDAGEFYTWAASAFAHAETEGKPFFYMINTHDPHRQFWGINKALEINESRTPVPSHIYSAEDVRVPPSIPDLHDVRLETQYYYSTLRRGDDFVEEMLQALDDSGLADNTIVIFYSDHGWAMPFAKTNLWNASTRTPLIVRWPGKIAPNSINSSEMVSVIDFLPTILDVAGIAIPSEAEGNTFKPLLLGESQPEVNRDKIFKTYYENSGAKRRPMRAVQTKRYNYIFNPWSNGTTVMQSTTQGTGSFLAMVDEGLTNPEVQARVDLYNYRVLEEFYDLDNDPYELDNKIDDPAYASVISGLKADMKEWMIKVNDPAMAAFVNMGDQAYLENWMGQQQAEADIGKNYPQLKKNAIDPTTFFYPNNDYYNITTGAILNVTVDKGLTSNDYDAAGATGMTVSIVTRPENGNLTLRPDGSFVYFPRLGFTGTDVFTYQVSSVGTSDVGTAKVYVSVVGDSETEVIFSDIFESGTLAENGWSNSGGGSIAYLSGAAYSGNNGVRVKKGAKLEKTISTVGYKGIKLHYSRKTTGLTDSTNLTVEWSLDGNNWNPVEVTQDTGWATKTLNLPASVDGQPALSIRFNTNGSLNVEQADIDNVSIKATPDQTPITTDIELYRDDFESATVTVGGWVNTSTSGSLQVASEAASSGSYGARIKNGAIMSTSVATQDYTHFEVSYERQAVSLAAPERLDVEWSIDGITWNLLETVQTTTEMANKVFTFSASPASEISLRFAVYSNKNVEKALVDNVVIKGLASL